MFLLDLDLEDPSCPISPLIPSAGEEKIVLPKSTVVICMYTPAGAESRELESASPTTDQVWERVSSECGFPTLSMIFSSLVGLKDSTICCQSVGLGRDLLVNFREIEGWGSEAGWVFEEALTDLSIFSCAIFPVIDAQDV